MRQQQWSRTASKYNLDTSNITLSPTAAASTGALSLPLSILQHPITPHDFLTDGARALAAFCRPYPIRIIGKPKNISYTIGTATFKLTVLVSSEDATAHSSGFSTTGDVDDLPPLPHTEIFLPLTAFSQAPAIPSTEALINHRRSTSSEADLITDESHGVHHTHRKGHHKHRHAHPSVAGGLSQVHMSFVGGHVASGTAVSSVSSLPLNVEFPIPLHIPKDILDIDVTVSDGTWEADGQTLRWWYPIPTGSYSKEYSITVRKRREVSDEVEDAGCIIL